jgi:hypothetical protein
MKSLYQVALAAGLVFLMNCVPAYAYASKNAGGKQSQSHSQTYHDRTPTVHTHTLHHHRG